MITLSWWMANALIVRTSAPADFKAAKAALGFPDLSSTRLFLIVGDQGYSHPAMGSADQGLGDRRRRKAVGQHQNLALRHAGRGVDDLDDQRLATAVR